MASIEICQKFTIVSIVVIVLGLLSTESNALPTDNSDNKPSRQGIDNPYFHFLGATSEKELYITKEYKATYYFALGIGCGSYGLGGDLNLTLGAIETKEEVEMLDRYFVETSSEYNLSDDVWTSGIDRLGVLPGRWASTGEIISYPSHTIGYWYAGQDSSPLVASYTCISIWRNCNRVFPNGPTIPFCNPAPYGTWFTPRPCLEEKRFICEKRL